MTDEKKHSDTNQTVRDVVMHVLRGDRTKEELAKCGCSTCLRASEVMRGWEEP